VLKVTDPTLVDDDGQQQRVAWQDVQVFAPTPAEMPQPAQLHDIIRLHRIQARGGQRLPLRLPAARAAALPAARAAVQGRGQRIAGSLTRAARGAQVQELLQGIAQGVSRARAQVQELHQGIAQGVARARAQVEELFQGIAQGVARARAGGGAGGRVPAAGAGADAGQPGAGG